MKNKRAQVFGMSFNMIFSILLIVFFLAAAFIAIRFFLNFQKDVQLGLFTEELQKEIDKAWNSQSSSFVYDGELPRGITHVCFLNLSSDKKNADVIEQEVFDDVSFSGLDNKVNFVFWPTSISEDINYKIIKHIQLPEDNPHCIEVKNNIANIKIEKDFTEALVSVR